MHQPISCKAELYKPRNGEAGTETCRVVKPSSVKTKEPPSPCGFTYGIAVYGPVCTVVWEGRAGNRSPYPDLSFLCVLSLQEKIPSTIYERWKPRRTVKPRTTVEAPDFSPGKWVFR